MGTYYTILNHTKRQKLDPGQIGGGNIKASGIAHGDAGRILAFAMINDWIGDHVVVQGDWGDDDPGAGYEDVTEQIVRKFNADDPKKPIAFNPNG